MGCQNKALDKGKWGKLPLPLNSKKIYYDDKGKETKLMDKNNLVEYWLVWAKMLVRMTMV